MRGNSFGNVFNLMTFGESHGPAMGAIVDGCPAGVLWRPDLLQKFLDRRRPGQSDLVTARNELDRAEILSGVFENKTLGTPIAMLIRNENPRSQDYDPKLIETRLGHATDLWQNKFGHSDPRGSGRASGRETVSRILGGAVARMLVEQLHPDIRILAYTAGVGDVVLESAECAEIESAFSPDPWSIDKFSLRMPLGKKNAIAESKIRAAKENGESFGGLIRIHISNAPQHLGEPVFGKLKNRLADALLSIGGTIAFEFGDGFHAATTAGQSFHSLTQQYGGMRGGLSTGGHITTCVAFKPTASRAEVARRGRHDPCIVPRAVPVVEAMIWLLLADLILLKRLDQI